MKNIKRIIALVLAIMCIMAIAIPAMVAQVTMNNVNVRKGPGTSYSVVKVLSPGTEVTVRFHALGSSLNGSKDWYCVTWWESTGGYSGYYREGYIHGSYLTNTSISTVRPSSKGSAFGAATLQYGSKGIYVYNMQLVLYKNGYLNSLNSCDGIYGKATENALKSFQRDHVIELYEGEPVDDGLAGTRTKDALWQMRNINGTSTDILQSYGAVFPNG